MAVTKVEIPLPHPWSEATKNCCSHVCSCKEIDKINEKENTVDKFKFCHRPVGQAVMRLPLERRL